MCIYFLQAGNTALDYAEGHGHSDVATLLRVHSGNVHVHVFIYLMIELSYYTQLIIDVVLYCEIL